MLLFIPLHTTFVILIPCFYVECCEFTMLLIFLYFHFLQLNSTHHRNILGKVDNRSSTYAELVFEISQDSFRNGRLLITCHANVFQLYKMNVSAHIDEERPRLASVLGTRDSPHTGEFDNSRG